MILYSMEQHYIIGGIELKSWRKVLFSSLLAVSMLSFTQSASAAAYDPYEPNNNYTLATPISPYVAYNGVITKNDGDYYQFSPTPGQHFVSFFPPDNQSYLVLLYDAADVYAGGGNATSLKAAMATGGQAAIMDFYTQPGKTYIVVVMGWNAYNDDAYYTIGWN